MSLRVFDLDRDGSQTISISQESVRAAILVQLNDRLLGTLTTPEEKSTGRAFTLDDGAVLTVKVVNKQVQVRHNGLPLFPIKPKKEPSRALVTKRVILICSILAFGLGSIGLCSYVNTFYNIFHSAPPSNSLTAVLLGGYVLFALIALLVGLGHAVAHHSWGWVAFGFLPPLVLGSILMVYWLHFPLEDSYGNANLTNGIALVFLTIPLVLLAFLVPVVCLIYTRSLEEY